MSSFSDFKKGFIQISLNSEEGSKITGNFQVKNDYGHLIYKGDIVNGQREGQGAEYLGNEYSNSCDEGNESDVRCHNLPIYKGEWKNDHYEGIGNLYEIKTCYYDCNETNYNRTICHGTFEKGVLKKGVKIIYDNDKKWNKKAWNAFRIDDFDYYTDFKAIFGAIAFEVGSWDENNQFSGKKVPIPEDSQIWEEHEVTSLEDYLQEFDISLTEII